jgi:hypothetical protein
MVPMLLAVHDRYALLAGLNAPTKSISAKVDATANQGQYTEFIQATVGLDGAGMGKVLDFARSLPRPATIKAEPPDNSPLWNEQLEEKNGEKETT